MHKGVNVMCGLAYRNELNVNTLLTTTASELTDLVANTVSNSQVLGAGEKPQMNLGTSTSHTPTDAFGFL